jgi:F-type H+-transporting ATPase subunit epsilon
MAGSFKFELITPERVAVSEDADQVVVPGVEGEFTVLAGHSPVISALRPGVIDAMLSNARRLRLFVKGGFAEVGGDHLTVLAERALDIEAMDAGTIAEELETAEAELAAAHDDSSRLVAFSAVERLKSLQR